MAPVPARARQQSWPPAISSNSSTRNSGANPIAISGLQRSRNQTIATPLAAALAQLEDRVGAVLRENRFPLVLGGEHALTAGAIRPFAGKYDDLAVLHIDAHADLRDGYLGEHFSHASAMRRVLDHDNVSLVSVGIRAISAAEADYAQANRDRIAIHWAKDQANWDHRKDR